MNQIALTIPRQDIELGRLDPAPNQVKYWLEHLQRVDIDDSTQRLLHVLRSYNRCQLEPAIRFKIVNLLRPIVEDAVAALIDRNRGKRLNVTSMDKDVVILVHQFYTELAYAYKIVLTDLVGFEKNYKADSSVLHLSIFYALDLLSRHLVSTYYFYMPEPPGIWGEIHRLYWYSVQHELSELIVEDDDSSSTLSQIYKKIVLLSLGNPYQLMPGEALVVYRMLSEWVKYVTFDDSKSHHGENKLFCINQCGEEGPRFMVEKLISPKQNVKILDLNHLVKNIKELIDDIQSHGVDSIGFSIRMQRNMLLRLERAWGGRLQRKTPRHPLPSQILLIVGLSPSHHFISNEAEFKPEFHEIHFYRPNSAKESFSLMPKEFEPWKAEDIEEKIEVGVAQMRTSKYSNDLDIWEKVYATKAKARAEMDKKQAQYTAQIWDQTDKSHGGMGLMRDFAAEIQVGELVAYKAGVFSDQNWEIGVIRWLREGDSGDVKIGLMKIECAPRPVAVRAIGGVGKGGEYFRSLMLTADSMLPSIIVPANIYDRGTRLVLNLVTNIMYVQLLNIIDSTASFSQFQYQEISMPESEKVNIQALKNA